ncbi:MAG: helix-turn-helix transcriptional regulator [bacterium]|nr:helix-turn-helix transcriptional regulator [bacterium]
MSALTRCERDVLRLVGLCKSDREIARACSRTVGTVRFHLYHIRVKLGVRRREHLALVAVLRGLSRAPSDL